MLNNFTTAVFLDIEKAFDMCPRWGILQRLYNIGLRGHLPIFIQNFLQNRYFRVKVGNQFSNQHCQKNGVPQGSVLSPTLFILMINNILPNPRPRIKISFFADDIVIWTSSSHKLTCMTRLQTALDSLQTWSDNWGLRFSPNKTKAVIFMRPTLRNSHRYRNHAHLLSLNNTNIEFVSNYKYLGVVLDSSLTWAPQIQTLKNSLSKE